MAYNAEYYSFLLDPVLYISDRTSIFISYSLRVLPARGDPNLHSLAELPETKEPLWLAEFAGWLVAASSCHWRKRRGCTVTVSVSVQVTWKRDKSVGLF